jgi:hypothetical protein
MKIEQQAAAQAAHAEVGQELDVNEPAGYSQ